MAKKVLFPLKKKNFLNTSKLCWYWYRRTGIFFIILKDNVLPKLQFGEQKIDKNEKKVSTAVGDGHGSRFFRVAVCVVSLEGAFTADNSYLWPSALSTPLGLYTFNWVVHVWGANRVLKPLRRKAIWSIVRTVSSGQIFKIWIFSYIHRNWMYGFYNKKN